MGNRLKVSRVFMALLGLVLNQTVSAEVNHWQMNMHRGVTPISHAIYDLHMIAIVICAIIGVVVFGLMTYSLIHHRKSKGYIPATFHDNFHLEVVWSIIPFLILIGLAIPATKVLIKTADTGNSDVTVKVVGSQWKWQYQYLDQGISFFSNLATPYAQIRNQQEKGKWYLLEVDKPLVLPINKKIRFLVTANDVVHSWWVPEFGIKRDAFPGFMYESWARIEKPGTYRGQCAELCGIHHGFMPIVVQAVTENEFEQWVANQPKVKDQYAQPQAQPAEQPTVSQAELMALGQQKYEQLCSACHGADGKGIPPLYPALKGSSVAVGKPISRHILVILQGVPGSAMQPYKDQLTDKEIAAVVTYERNAWENNTGDLVQPADVAKIRQSGIQKPKIVKMKTSGGLR
jgi:cytochrome c oxidase subunit II